MSKLHWSSTDYRQHRHARIRTRVRGTADRPRLAVFRSLKHISAQLIDDSAGRTLVAAADTDIKTKHVAATAKIAREVGKLIADRAQQAKIASAVFDRGGHEYHGQVQALADGAREGGLKF